MWLLILFSISVILCYRLIISNYGYWKKRGVPGPLVSIIIKNTANNLFGRKSVSQIYTDVYNAFPSLPYVGYYKIREPVIIVRDPELIKDILIKEFQSFHDNDFRFDEKVDPIWGRNPFATKGERWKVNRNQLTPCFTNRKLKTMFPLIDEVGKRLVKYLNVSEGENGYEAKELALKYTTDVVADCMFGIEGHSFEDPKAVLKEVVQRIFTVTPVTVIKHTIVSIIPFLANAFDIKFFPDNVAKYIRSLVNQSLKCRKENKIVRGDFLDIMEELKSKLGNHKFTNDDMYGHAGTLLSEGTETSSIAISYILFELANNIDEQVKLRNHIEEALIRNGGKFSFDCIVEMDYVDNVFRESLRKNPPFQFMAKICTNDVKWATPYDSENEPNVTIKKGLKIFISIYGIHHDPKYYPDPESFQPDRFSVENKNNLTNGTFLSFGDGPRICLGEKFAKLQIKTAVAYIIANFEVKLNKKTISPLEIDPHNNLLKPKGGIYLNFYKIKSILPIFK